MRPAQAVERAASMAGPTERRAADSNAPAHERPGRHTRRTPGRRFARGVLCARSARPAANSALPESDSPTAARAEIGRSVQTGGGVSRREAPLARVDLQSDLPPGRAGQQMHR